MNILICVFFRAPFGGLHANVFSTARHCLRRGHRVTVVCREGAFREQLAAAGVHTIATDYSSAEGSLASVLADSGGPYDVIHAHPFASRELALQLGRKLAVPVVMTYHGMYEDELANLAGEYAAIVAVSAGIRDHLASVFPGCRHKLFVAPNGVDRSLFRPHEGSPQVALDGVHRKTRIALVSRLDRDKRLVIEILLKALRHSAEAHRGQVSWTIVGEGSELDAVKAEAAALARRGDFEVYFAGWLQGEQLADAYRDSDVVIAPGRCALEAMACGRPVIAIGSKQYVGLITPDNWQAGAYSNFGGLGRGLEGYEEGRVERDLSMTIANPELRSALGALGVKLTLNFYDDEAINEHLLALYETCASSKAWLARDGKVASGEAMTVKTSASAAHRQRVVFWDRQSRAGREDVFELEISAIEFPERTYFLEHVYDVVKRQATSQVIAASRDHIHVSDDVGHTWRAILLPTRGQYFACFTTHSGHHLLQKQDDGGGVHLFDPQWEYLGRRDPGQHPWHGSWSIDQSSAGTIMFAEYWHEGGVMRVMKSEDDGKSWCTAFEVQAEVSFVSRQAIRHFHTCQADPFEVDVWWLSSGDEAEQNKLWCSRDNGLTWLEAPHEHRSSGLHSVPERRRHHVKRHTAEIFTEQWIYWGTDDNLARRARLARSPRSLTPGPIEVLTTFSRNAIRNFLPLDANIFVAISEAKHDVSQAQLFCVDLEGTLLARFNLPNPSMQGSGFCRSRSSRAAIEGTFFSFCDGQVLEPGLSFLKWQMRRSTHSDAERDRLALLERANGVAKAYGRTDPETLQLQQRYASHFQCNVCNEGLEAVFCETEHGAYAGTLEPSRFWEASSVEYPCPHCSSRARTRTGRVLQAKHLRNLSGRVLMVSESLAEVRHLKKRYAQVTHVALQGDFGDPNILTGVDITQMPQLGDERFNVFWACVVLDYIPELEAAAREGYRVLAPGGEMVFFIMPYRLVDDGTGCVVKHMNALAHEKYAQQGGAETGIPDCRFGVAYVLEVFRDAGFAIRRQFVFDQLSRTSQSWFIAQKPGVPAAAAVVQGSG
jgi:glycosyltransferase involved in cell wall biosynthesis